jgi:hypothetical protein
MYVITEWHQYGQSGWTTPTFFLTIT